MQTAYQIQMIPPICYAILSFMFFWIVQRLLGKGTITFIMSKLYERQYGKLTDVFESVTDPFDNERNARNERIEILGFLKEIHLIRNGVNKKLHQLREYLECGWPVQRVALYHLLFVVLYGFLIGFEYDRGGFVPNTALMFTFSIVVYQCLLHSMHEYDEDRSEYNIYFITVSSILVLGFILHKFMSISFIGFDLNQRSRLMVPSSWGKFLLLSPCIVQYLVLSGEYLMFSLRIAVIQRLLPRETAHKLLSFKETYSYSNKVVIRFNSNAWYNSRYEALIEITQHVSIVAIVPIAIAVLFLEAKFAPISRIIGGSDPLGLLFVSAFIVLCFALLASFLVYVTLRNTTYFYWSRQC